LELGELLERVACIPPVSTSPAEAVEAVARASCRVAELRLDLQPWSPEQAASAVETLSSRGVRVVVTLRDYREGGRYRGGDEEKLELLSYLVDRGAWLADFEYRFPLLDEALHSLPGRVLVSVHFMEYTPWPEILYAMAGDMLRRGARVAKLVSYARSLEDNWRLLGVNIKWPGRAAAFAMGPQGRPSRILAPLLGAALVYAPLGEAVAPGQLSLRELIEAWRLLGVLEES
jgi:3-dehydroquinate dehydratase-1